ncbi:MAG: DNA gyrase inhibitor YacG, partial [Saccharospirillum sp.]
MSAKAPPKVPCPTCKKPITYSKDNTWRPFCSERCK